MAKPSTETKISYSDFTTVKGFNYGYRNREDITTLPPGVLVEGSQNVLTNTFQRIGARKGYTLDGQANSALAPIRSSFDWVAGNNLARHVRTGFLTSAGNDGKMQFRFVHDDGEIEWIDLLTGLDFVDFNYTTFFNTDALQVEMLAVNGSSNIFEWFGGAVTLASATNTAGIIARIEESPNTLSLVDSGGVDYAVGDRLTITGGSGTAVVEVLTVAAGAIKTSAVGAGGSGYVIGDAITVDGAGIAPYAHLEVLTTGGGGSVATYTVVTNGYGYTVANNVTTITGGAGTGFELNITAIGDAVSGWDFVSDADHGSGYSTATLVPVTGGSGTNGKIKIETITSGTITKTGTATWAESGFVVGPPGSARLSLTINGIAYNYGTLFPQVYGDTTTLYGVTPDPSAIAVGSVVVQSPFTLVNGTNNDLGVDFGPTLISTLDQRVFVGATGANPANIGYSKIFVSEFNDFTSYADGGTISTPGQPYSITLTSIPTAFIPQEQYMYLSAGNDEWYTVNFTLSADFTKETCNVLLLNTSVQQATQTQASTTKIGNDISYLSFEPIINTLGRVTNNFSTPLVTDLSYSIVNLMNDLDFTDACVFYYRKFVYVAVPSEGLVLMYNMTDPKNPYWEAPQVLPISRFSIIDGDLYGHSSQVSESYKLFDGTNDNGFSVQAKAKFSFNNYGTRTSSKAYNQFYVEGYINPNTTVALGIQYDIDGCATNTSFDIDGDDAQIVCLAGDDVSLGKSPLGKNPLGGGILDTGATVPPKFRVIKTFPINYFYEDQISFESNGLDQVWELLAFGPQLTTARDLNTSITQ